MNKNFEFSGSIFYIDDDQDDLDFFNDAIESLGENVKLFLFPDDMFKILKNPPPKPSVIFLDLNMPLKTGFEIILEIKKGGKYNNLPLIVYSTSSNSEIIDRCRDLGASLFITKPTSLAALKKAIEYVLKIDWSNHKSDKNNFLYTA
jgi:response regulator RpfG family c-di-GMP phosphodiesterase